MQARSITAKRADVRIRDPYLLLALALALLAALPLLIGPGIVNTRAGGDSPFLILRVDQLARNLRAGIFPARLMPDAAQGLGYPFFNFYGAFPYYLAALLCLAGAGVLWSIKVIQVAGFLLAGAAMYGLARRLRAKPAGALLASAAYTFAPFHLVNVYVRGDSLSEFYALALFPLILWALLALRERPGPATIALLAGSYALLPLTHNISALIFSPLLGLWLLAVALERGGRDGWRVLGAGVVALGLGLALSAWFWAPALREQSLVQLQDQTTGYFHYSGHFRGTDLVQWSVLQDYTIDTRRDPFRMGLFQAALAVLGLAALIARALRERRLDASQGMAALALLAYTWLITPASRWAWAHVPLLPMVQFPWRMLSVQALAIALLAANLPALWPVRWRWIRRHALDGAGVIGGALALLAAITGLAGLRVDRLPLTEADITPQRLMLYETFSGNIGSTVRNEYLSREMLPRPYVSGVQLNGGDKPSPLALEGTLGEARLLASAPTDEEWQITVPTRSLLAFHTAFYPGWEATVDGAAQGVEPLDGLGLIGLRLEPGAHTVRLRLGRTPVRRYAEWLSLLGLGGWLLLGALAARRYSRRLFRRRIVTASGALSVLAILFILPAALPKPGALWGAPLTQVGEAAAPTVSHKLYHPNQSPLPGPLVMDFSRAPYLHHEPQGIDWGDVNLQGYQLDTEARPGKRITLAMDWKQPVSGAVVTARLMGVTAHLLEPAPIWAEASATIVGQQTLLALPLPEEIPPGLYVPRITVSRDGAEQPPRTAAGVGMSVLSLAPVQVVRGTWADSPPATGQKPALASFGPEHVPPVISLIEAEAAIRPDGQVEVRLTWRSERQAPLNYMLSVRLRDQQGEQIASRDLPPLLGGYPTSLWQPGELVTDRVVLPLPDGPAAGGYRLEIVLYNRQTLQAAGVPLVQEVSFP